MAQTTNGIPYPIGTDRVMDGDNAMEAIARAVDPSVASTTTTGALSAGVTGRCNAYRRGRSVFVVFDLTTASGTGAGFALATLPPLWRPIEQWFFLGLRPDAGQVSWSMEATVNGIIVPNVSALPAAARVIGSIEFPLPPTQA